MDKITKEEIKEMATDIAAVVAEELQGQFKAFGEDLTSVKRTVNLLAEDMDHVKSDIIDMKGDIKEIKEDIIEIREELVEINGKLDKKAEKKVVDDHENRIIKLENTALADA
jgi:hypothetical protein